MNSKSITLKSFVRQNKLTDIVPEHCFDVTLVIISDNWMLSHWIALIIFQGSQQILSEKLVLKKARGIKVHSCRYENLATHSPSYKK